MVIELRYRLKPGTFYDIKKRNGKFAVAIIALIRGVIPPQLYIGGLQGKWS